MSTMPQDKKNVIVTGTSGGLGFTVSKMFLQEGFHVLGISRGKRQEALKKLTSIATQNKTPFESITADFENPNNLSKQLATGKIQLDPKQILHLIICHGVNFNMPLDKLDWETIEKSMRINFGSPFVLAKYFFSEWVKLAKQDKKNKQDRSIIYISSVAAKTGAPQELAYHAAKRAMDAAMLSFAREGAPYGIRANVVSPGLMDTEMGRQTVKERPDVLTRIPLGKLTGVEEIANLVLFLIKSPSTTGQNIHVNGGRYFTI